MSARRMLRFYPRPWRDRYGEELTQLVADVEGPGLLRKLRVRVDMARQGLALRLDATGLTGFPLATEERRRWGLVSALVGVVTFLVGAFAVFRYMRGWQNYGLYLNLSRDHIVPGPHGGTIFGVPTVVDHPLAGAPVVLSRAAAVGFVGIAVLVMTALLPIVVSCARALRARPRGRVLRPLVGLGVGAGLGVGGYLAHRTEWQHINSGSGTLKALSIQIGRARWGITYIHFWQYVFVVLSAAALALAVLNISKLVRRLDIGPRAWGFEAGLVRAVTWLSALSVACTAAWMIWVAALEPTYFSGATSNGSVHDVISRGVPVVQHIFWVQTGVRGTWLWPTLLGAGVLIVASLALVRRAEHRIVAVIDVV